MLTCRYSENRYATSSCSDRCSKSKYKMLLLKEMRAAVITASGYPSTLPKPCWSECRPGTREPVGIGPPPPEARASWVEDFGAWAFFFGRRTPALKKGSFFKPKRILDVMAINQSIDRSMHPSVQQSIDSSSHRSSNPLNHQVIDPAIH